MADPALWNGSKASQPASAAGNPEIAE